MTTTTAPSDLCNESLFIAVLAVLHDQRPILGILPTTCSLPKTATGVWNLVPTHAFSGMITAGTMAGAGITMSRRPPTPMQTVEFTTDKRFIRRRRELRIIQTMVGLYCRGQRHERRAPLCAECTALLEYATRRLERCVFGDAKPTCANCAVHCYKADMREQVRVVMRWAGPRMMLRHPIMALTHLIDERRPVPRLPARQDSTAQVRAREGSS